MTAKHRPVTKPGYRKLVRQEVRPMSDNVNSWGTAGSNTMLPTQLLLYCGSYLAMALSGMAAGHLDRQTSLR